LSQPQGKVTEETTYPEYTTTGAHSGLLRHGFLSPVADIVVSASVLSVPLPESQPEKNMMAEKRIRDFVIAAPTFLIRY
jgi:hypothetical protein